MISLGCGEAHLRMIVEKYGIHHKIDVHLKSKSKGIAQWMAFPCKEELEKLLGVSSIVFFQRILPSFKMVRRQGRRFIDMELCQLDKMYLPYLTKYKSVLKQRNETIKTN